MDAAAALAIVDIAVIAMPSAAATSRMFTHLNISIGNMMAA